MDPHQLQPAIEALWVYVAAPLAVLAALVLSWRLRFTWLLQLPAAFRAMRAHDPGADGSVHPATSVAMSTVAAYGGAAAIGAATAVSLGGAGAIAWVWVFGLVLAPLRMGEALLSRTSPPGHAGEATGGTLAGRLLADPASGVRVLGWLLLVLVPVASFAFIGGTHGEAVLEAARELHPDSALPMGLAVAGVAAVAAILPMKKSGSILGWIAAVALIALFGAGLFAFMGDPGRGLRTFGRAVSDALDGANSAGAFSGALAGEVAMAALIYLLPPIAATGGVEGAWHSEAQAATTKGYAPAALAGPFLYVVLTTLVGLSLVATSAFSTPVETTRPLQELTFYRVGFDTVSQRRETDRLYSGFIRVTEGETGVIEIHPATSRGMIRNPVFEEGGDPADIALHVNDGAIDNLQKPGTLGALTNRPLEELDQVSIRGRMLPRGGALLGASMTSAGGSLLSRVALAALLLLAALGAAAWGFGVRKTLAARVPANIARWTGLIPGVGLAVAAGGFLEGFGALGILAAGALAVVSSLALIVRSKDAADIAK